MYFTAREINSSKQITINTIGLYAFIWIIIRNLSLILLYFLSIENNDFKNMMHIDVTSPNYFDSQHKHKVLHRLDNTQAKSYISIHPMHTILWIWQIQRKIQTITFPSDFSFSSTSTSEAAAHTRTQLRTGTLHRHRVRIAGDIFKFPVEESSMT